MHESDYIQRTSVQVKSGIKDHNSNSL